MVIIGKIENTKIHKEMKKKKELQIDNLLSKKTLHDENFPVGSFLISKENINYTRKFYKFSRTADDIADNSRLKISKKLKILTRFDELLKNKENSDYSFINDILSLQKRKKFNDNYPRKLLVAFIQDASKSRYADWNELINYCEHSASPVGRFVVDLHEIKENLAEIYVGCDHLCNSLQILNHLQDCKEDFLNLDRIYIPENMFKKEKIKTNSFLEMKNRKAFIKVKNNCINKVKDLLDQSISKIKLISNFRLRMETLVIFFIAKRLAFLLEINDPIEKKVKLNYIDLIFCFFKGIIGAIKFNAK